VQIISSLYHSFPTQRTVVITHSNAALNDIFQKVTARGDVNERFLVRLGSGERDLETDSTHDFTKAGRVAYSLGRRGVLLEQVQLLSEALGLSGRAERGADGSPSYTCETAEYFRANQLKKCIGKFQRQVKASRLDSEDADVAEFFPLSTFFKLQKNDKLSMADASKHLALIEDIFNELAEYRPLELLRSQRQRTDYLLIKQARVVAMTCTHAAIARRHLMELDETFIPLLLQRGEADDSLSSGLSRLKRVCLMGDHNQLPPVIKNQSFARYSNLDQSMFSRLIHLGAPYIQLDKQGRARSELANLYRWRYDNLGDLNHVLSLEKFRFANPGFVHAFQIINVDKFQGKGEITPTAYFYQNHGEAEYVVALFMVSVQRLSI
jgi:intron-binding protein aquarius